MKKKPSRCKNPQPPLTLFAPAQELASTGVFKNAVNHVWGCVCGGVLRLQTGNQTDPTQTPPPPVGLELGSLNVPSGGSGGQSFASASARKRGGGQRVPGLPRLRVGQATPPAFRRGGRGGSRSPSSGLRCSPCFMGLLNPVLPLLTQDGV